MLFNPSARLGAAPHVVATNLEDLPPRHTPVSLISGTHIRVESGIALCTEFLHVIGALVGSDELGHSSFVSRAGSEALLTSQSKAVSTYQSCSQRTWTKFGCIGLIFNGLCSKHFLLIGSPAGSWLIDQGASAVCFGQTLRIGLGGRQPSKERRCYTQKS